MKVTTVFAKTTDNFQHSTRLSPESQRCTCGGRNVTLSLDEYYKYTCGMKGKTAK